MFSELALPLIKQRLPLERTFVCRTLRTTGIGETFVQERIADRLQVLVNEGLEIGYCARLGQVDLRLAASVEGGERLVTDAEKIVRGLLSQNIFSTESEDIEAVIIRLLTEREETVSLAESCIGGCIAHRLTNVPGASAVFVGGLVTYSNEAKQELLGVNRESLAKHGAVSKEVAREMAEGAREKMKSTYAVSVTGIAGPGGGSPVKPLGTVFIGLAAPSGTTVEHNLNPYDRETFKQVTAQQALELLRRGILNRG